MPHHTKDKGDLALAQVIADLIREGIHACLPISDYLPFDLIAVSPSFKDLRRIQVRYAATNKRGGVELALRKTHADSRGNHIKYVRLDDVDAFAIFSPMTGTVYYVRRDEIPLGVHSCFVLRLRPAQNGQVARTRPAGDYEGT